MSKMRTKLLATAAAAALIGCTTYALAQTGGSEGQPSKDAVQPKGGEQHQTAPGGAMGHAQPAPGGSMQKQGLGEQHPGQGVSKSEDHGNTTMQRGAQGSETGKSGVNAQEHAQTQGGKTDKREGSAQTQQGGQTQENAQTQRSGGQIQQNAAESKGSAGKAVQLSEQQRTQIKGAVGRSHDVARANSVNFNISLGTAVPRSVHFAVLPVEIATIVPEYRGFDYIIVGDQLLIIDPQTLEIVAILPA
jgi:Protein of unknown function (DUF1236)